MADGIFNIVRIDAMRSPSTGLFTFTAVMDPPDNSGEMRICVSEDEVLGYQAFQRRIITATGWVYRHSSCEGRPSEVADENWRATIAAICVRSGPSVADIAPTNCR